MKKQAEKVKLPKKTQLSMAKPTFEPRQSDYRSLTLNQKSKKPKKWILHLIHTGKLVKTTFPRPHAHIIQ